MEKNEINKVNKELIRLNKKLQESRNKYMKSVKEIKDIKEKIWENTRKLILDNSAPNQEISNQDLIEENIKRIKRGQSLNAPLSQLGSLFKLEYKKRYNADIPLTSAPKYSCENVRYHYSFERKCIICRSNFKTKSPLKITCSKKCRSEYVNLPEIIKIRKEKIKEYRQKPEVKERLKEYYRQYHKKDLQKII